MVGFSMEPGHAHRLARADTSAVGADYLAMCPPDTWPQALRVPQTGLPGPYRGVMVVRGEASIQGDRKGRARLC